MVVLLENGEYCYINKDDIVAFNVFEGYIKIKITCVFIFKISFYKKLRVLSSWLEDNQNILFSIIKGE